MTCYDCIHCDACSDAGDSGFSCLKEDVSKCKHFKNKADFVEVVRCKKCKDKDVCWQKVDCGYQYREIVYCSCGERSDT